MNNKLFEKMAKQVPKVRVKINPRIAVNRGFMVGWVSMLTVGAMAGFAFGYLPAYYPYTLNSRKK